MSLGVFFFFVPAAAHKRAVLPRLQELFPDRADEVWQATRAWQARLAPDRPRHTTMVNLLIRHMEWFCALYRAVQDQGMGQTEARALVEAVMEDVFQPVLATFFRLSWLRGGNPESRAKWLLHTQIRFLFTAPFVHRFLPAQSGVSFNVERCPLADYFKDQGAPELTSHAACNIDYCMAREYGLELHRTKTIAGGADHCDFRFKVPDKDAVSS